MPDRKYYGQNYRFGFNGQEKSDEIKGNGNSYTAEFWEYDPRIARRWNIDPLTKSWESPYATLGNNPINLTDFTGLTAEKPTGTGTEGQAKETVKRIYGARGSRDETTVWFWHGGGLTTGVQKWNHETNTPEPVLSSAGWYTSEQYTEILSKSNAVKALANDLSLYNDPSGLLKSNIDKGQKELEEFVGKGFNENTLAHLVTAAQIEASSANFYRTGTTYSSGANVEDLLGIGIVLKQGGKMIGRTVLRNLAVDEEVKGGLNLFKWKSPQAEKSSGWQAGDYFLYLPNKGVPKLNWAQNYGSLRREMNLGKPIFDSYRMPNGNLIPAGGFLRVERYILQSRGWIYNPTRGAWMPPTK